MSAILILDGNAFRLTDTPGEELHTAPLLNDGTVDDTQWGEPEYPRLPDALVAQLHTIRAALRNIPTYLESS